MRPIRLSIMTSVMIIFSGLAATPAKGPSYHTSQAEGSSFCAAATNGLGVSLGANYDNVWACGTKTGGPGNFPVPGPHARLDLPSFEESAFGFQCTELADRFLWAVYGLGPMYYSKYNDFNLVGGNFVSSAAASYGLHTMSNNSNGPPSIGDLPVAGDIISMWGETGQLVETGGGSHVAVVTSNPTRVAGGGWSIETMEENAHPQSTGWNTISVSQSGVWVYGPGSNHYKYTNYQWLVLRSPATTSMTWTAVSPTAKSQGDTELLGDSCTGPGSCIAVGDSFNAVGDRRALVDSFSGSTWAVVPSPDPSPTQNQLNAVSCPSSDNCIAVGSVYAPGQGNGTRPIIESWRNSKWTMVAQEPKLANIDGTLNGVSCATTTYCIAVGTSTAGVASYTLIETFDGRAWSAAKSPSPLGYTGLPEDVLYAVSCVGPTFCVAVGTYQSHTGKNLALIETFGLASAPTRWTVSSAPNPDAATSNNTPLGVSCTSTTFCMAVLAYAGLTESLILEFDGNKWTLVRALNVDHQSLQFNGVSCVARTSCAVAGFYLIPGGSGNIHQAVVETYTNTGWAVVSVPPLPFGASNIYFQGVGCTPPSNYCLAVGSVTSYSTISEVPLGAIGEL